MFGKIVPKEVLKEVCGVSGRSRDVVGGSVGPSVAAFCGALLGLAGCFVSAPLALRLRAGELGYIRRRRLSVETLGGQGVVGGGGTKKERTRFSGVKDGVETHIGRDRPGMG